MQNTVRWHSDQFQPTHIWNPWSNETDANLEDSACTVRVLLFFSIPTEQRSCRVAKQGPCSRSNDNMLLCQDATPSVDVLFLKAFEKLGDALKV